jgi:hypothetical protein
LLINNAVTVPKILRPIRFLPDDNNVLPIALVPRILKDVSCFLETD